MEYNLNFMHPTYGTIFNADIDASFTVAEMTENLILSGFLPPYEAGYKLALGEQILANDSLFGEIQALEDGNVIRIITNKKTPKKEQAPTPSLTLHLIHPNQVLIVPVHFLANVPTSAIIKHVLDNNLLEANAADLILLKGKTPLDLDKSLLENQLTSGDYIRILDKQHQDPVEQVQLQIQQLQQHLQTELTTIKDNLPAANLLPIDPTRSVNPTTEPYQSIDTLVNQVRAASGQPPVAAISVLPTKYILMAAGAILMVLLIILSLVFG